MTVESPYQSMQGFISGQVQGVFFRAETQKLALQLGLRGWVRNTRDGRVELLIHGPAASLAEMRVWLHHGPSRARVSSVDLRAVDIEIPEGFEIIA